MTSEDLCSIYVDMGTTNTRVWLARGSDVLARERVGVGVRYSARERSSERIQDALKQLIASVVAQACNSSEDRSPQCVAAAGMISSSLGLAEVPHVQAPAGLKEIGSSARWFQFPRITDLPFLLVPGVRCGFSATSSEPPLTNDVMRGEETLCLGLTIPGLVKPPAVILNLGSHWKAIEIDSAGSIRSSVTSLSGEMIHVIQKETILADSVSDCRPRTISREWMVRGMAEQRLSGLPRALFCVRLMDIAKEGTPEDRFSFLAGAFIAADMDALIARGLLNLATQVVINGNSFIAEAWRSALEQKSISATVLTVDETETALLAGLRSILREAMTAKGAEASL